MDPSPWLVAGVAEVKARLAVAPPAYNIKVIDKDGIRTLAQL